MYFRTNIINYKFIFIVNMEITLITYSRIVSILMHEYITLGVYDIKYKYKYNKTLVYEKLKN